MSAPSLPRLFVSHNHNDNAFGFRLVADLRAALGGDETAVWYDVRGGLHGGDAWWNKIIEEITARPIFLVVLSPDAMASKWVQDEIGLAWQQKNTPEGKRIVPLLLHPCTVRADLRLLHIVSFEAPRPYAEALAELLATLGLAPASDPTPNSQPGQSPTVPTPVLPPADRAAALVRQMTAQIEADARAQDWQAVADRVEFLARKAPGALTPTIYRLQGQALMTLGRAAEAATAFDAALALDPDDVPTLHASARARLALGRAAEAVPLLQDALALSSDRTQRLALLADYVPALEAEHQDDEALRRTDEALRLAPDDRGWLERRLGLLQRLNRGADALVLQRTLAARPDATAARWLALAELTPDRGERTRALEAAARLAPSDPTVAAARARLLIIPPERFPERLADLGFAPHDENGVEHITPPLCAVPAGPFLIGSDPKKDKGAYPDEQPQHSVTLPAYSIARYPVTVAEYACAVRANAVPEPPKGTYRPITWSDQLQRLDHPVVCVSWQDAVAYAAWLAKLTGRPWRLPSEAEWEKAARGSDGRIYPWGEGFDKSRCNVFESGFGATTPVGAYADRSDASPCGAHDLAGNVWEWTSSLFERYPYTPDGKRERADSTGNRVLRGGSWDRSARVARAACRLQYGLAYRDGNFGFRLASAAADSF